MEEIKSKNVVASSGLEYKLTGEYTQKQLDLISKLNKCKIKIGKVETEALSRKSIEYNNRNSTIQAVEKVMKATKIDWNITLSSYPESKREYIQKTTKSGPQGKFVTYAWYNIEYVDLETGVSIVSKVLGSGEGDQPGQADGASRTYAIRQEFKDRFSIGINQNEYDEKDVKPQTFDANGNPVDKIDSSKISQISAYLTADNPSKETWSERKEKVLGYIEDHFGKAYSSIKDIPNEYALDVIKYASALSTSTDVVAPTAEPKPEET